MQQGVASRTFLSYHLVADKIVVNKRGAVNHRDTIVVGMDGKWLGIAFTQYVAAIGKVFVRNT
jgi:hypothetical protein